MGLRGGLLAGRAAARRGRVLPCAPRLRDNGRRRPPAHLPCGEACVRHGTGWASLATNSLPMAPRFRLYAVYVGS
eukprot:596310-Pleurochrysis_carterae.AAC.1